MFFDCLPPASTVLAPGIGQLDDDDLILKPVGTHQEGTVSVVSEVQLGAELAPE